MSTNYSCPNCHDADGSALFICIETVAEIDPDNGNLTIYDDDYGPDVAAYVADKTYAFCNECGWEGKLSNILDGSTKECN